MTDFQPSISYRVVGTSTGARRLSTSRRELRDIGISFAVLTFDLLLIFGGLTFLFGSGGAGFSSAVSPILVGIAAAAVVSGFVAHELAHKVVAQRRGYWAEFRLWWQGLVLSVVTAYFGFLFAAPGATVVSGMPYEDRRDWGVTSLAGPMSNVAFAAVFYAVSIPLFLKGSTLFEWFLLLAWINGWFGTFNMIPFGPLDGAKVLRWGRRYWVMGIVLTGTIAALSAFAIFVYGSPLLAW
jgi:Zn-dependent protease